MVLVNGFSMAYNEAGQGRPVLFVHGYPLNRQLWQPQLEGLSDVARILAPDLRGHGDSQVVPGPYSMELFADDLDALLDVLKVRQSIVMCGLSMGGYVTFAFYRKYAHRLAGLILTATRASADSLEAKEARDQAASVALQRGVEAIIDSMLPKLLSLNTLQSKPELVAQARAIMMHTSLEGILGDLEGLKNRPDSTGLLKEIKLPTLILHGEQDAIIPIKEVEVMAAAIPNSQMQVIPASGHLPNLENPEAFNRAVRRFLEDL